MTILTSRRGLGSESFISLLSITPVSLTSCEFYTCLVRTSAKQRSFDLFWRFVYSQVLFWRFYSNRLWKRWRRIPRIVCELKWKNNWVNFFKKKHTHTSCCVQIARKCRANINLYKFFFVLQSETSIDKTPNARRVFCNYFRLCYNSDLQGDCLLRNTLIQYLSADLWISEGEIQLEIQTRIQCLGSVCEILFLETGYAGLCMCFNVVDHGVMARSKHHYTDCRISVCKNRTCICKTPPR